MSTPTSSTPDNESVPAEWLEVSFCVSEQALPTLEALFWEQGAVAISRSDAGDTPVYEPAPNTTVVWPEVRLVGLFPVEQDLVPLLLALRFHLGDAADAVSVERILEQPWAELWRQHAKPACFGGRLWVIPEHPDDVPNPPAGPTIFLTPGLGFGTGNHPTTRLCLEYLAEHPPVGERIIDFGSGSGILSLAALALGAKVVYAIDHDPQALESTEANALINGFSAPQLQCLGPDDARPAQVDWIVANILAPVLMELKKEFSTYLKSQGRLVMSGILLEQADTLLAHFAPEWVLCEKRDEAEWTLVVLERRAAD
ncbi:MAG: 50S ribosomal protein L11 methyltransferase [Pseudomonadota bacterium]